jgi:hypothetical protein
MDPSLVLLEMLPDLNTVDDGGDGLEANAGRGEDDCNFFFRKRLNDNSNNDDKQEFRDGRVVRGR